MTWTYSGDPNASARDAIRFLVGDTDTTEQLLSDEEIAWINIQASGSATATDSLYECGHRACHAISAKFARQADKQIGDLQVQLSQRAAAYRAMADDLRQMSLRENTVPVPYAGGITISDKNIDADNPDIYRGRFRSGQFDDVRDGGGLNTSTGVQYFPYGANP